MTGVQFTDQKINVGLSLFQKSRHVVGKMVPTEIPSRSSAAESRLYESATSFESHTFIVNNPRVWTRVSQWKTLLGGKRLLFADS